MESATRPPIKVYVDSSVLFAAALSAFASFRSLFTNVVDPDASLMLRVAEEVEPKDAPIVAAAMTADVDYLTSYDQKHLLKQKDKIRSSFGVRS